MSAPASPYTAPPGYEAFTVLHAHSMVPVVARGALADAVRRAMTDATLFDFAARAPGARALQGRGTAWAAALPGGTDVVVRHARHGGLLASITRDLFLAPTRAPRELAAAIRLAGEGVPTPDVVAYAVYPALGPLVRVDVATRLLPGAAFPDAWRAADEARRAALVDAVALLLRALRRAGAHHPDLNARNVLVAAGPGAPTAAVLDVDRVTFGPPGSAALAARNVERLLGSIAKSATGVSLTARQTEALRATAEPGA